MADIYCLSDLEESSNTERTLRLIELSDSETIDVSKFEELENIEIIQNYSLKKITGLNKQIKKIYYPKHEDDALYSELLKNILYQVDLPSLLAKKDSQILLSVLAIPILKEKYPDFFDRFQSYSSKIKFIDITKTFLREDTISACTFNEAKKAEAYIDDWIKKNILPTMNSIEKFAKIYEFVIGLDYDNDSEKDRGDACSAFKMVLRKKGICVGYSQLLKYMCLKCGLQCEYVQACGRKNNYVFNEEGDNLSLCALDTTIPNLDNFIISNHAIVRFSPDGINWLFSDPTNDSLFVRTARKQNKKIRGWYLFCLPYDKMINFNVPHMYDPNGNEIIVSSELTKEISEQLGCVQKNMFDSNSQCKA